MTTHNLPPKQKLIKELMLLQIQMQICAERIVEIYGEGNVNVDELRGAAGQVGDWILDIEKELNI